MSCREEKLAPSQYSGTTLPQMQGRKYIMVEIQTEGWDVNMSSAEGFL